MRYLQPIVCSIVFLLLSVPALSQTDTIYFDKSWEKLPTRVEAGYYSVREKLPTGLVRSNDYYINGIKQMSGHFSNMDSLIEEGDFFYYGKEGKLSSQGSFAHGRKEGEWRNYRNDGVTLWYSEMIVNDSSHGYFRSYYPSGKLKREEMWDHGTRLWGKRYSEEGREMLYTPFQMMPVAPFDVSKYLSKNITYPKECRKKEIQGRVVVKFVVNTHGNIQGVQVTKSVHPLLDREAMRVIIAMPEWRPGMTDDEPVDVYYTLPIKFTLE